jgi:hypothetical protein
MDYNREPAAPAQALSLNELLRIGVETEGNAMAGRLGMMVFVAPLVAVLAIPAARAAENNDYPTVAIADYVFGCMSANGQTRQSLEKCSCSIDLIASILPYDRYVRAETILQMRRVGGDKGSLFKTEAHMVEGVAELRRAQAESEMRCF